jgi:hypothetical protein
VNLRSPALAGLLSLALVGAACGGGDADAEAGSGSGATEGTTTGAGAATLTGVLAIDAGTCEGTAPSGSWFRMVQPGGTPDAGPFVDNPDSSCTEKTTTAITPGTEGGLRVGDYQPQPEPNFLDDGTSAAAAIIQPQGFFAVRFGISTDPVDPQTQTEVPAPTATVDGDRLTVDHRALSVSWNGQHFNQGAPGPDGSGEPATGTYDPETGAYALDWTTTVVGGPFSGFVGVWHLEGTFQEG